MLVLSRKIGEAIVVDGKAVVRVIGTSGGKIRLGIEAERNVLVLREELPDKNETTSAA